MERRGPKLFKSVYIYIIYILHILYSGQTASHPVHPSKVGVKDLHENLKVKAPTSMGGTTLMKVL